MNSATQVFYNWIIPLFYQKQPLNPGLSQIYDALDTDKPEELKAQSSKSKAKDVFVTVLDSGVPLSTDLSTGRLKSRASPD